MSKKIALFIFIIAIYFASSSSYSLINLLSEPKDEPESEQKVVELTKTYTPQLWTDFKVLDIDAELCSLKGKNILESLSFKSIRRNMKYDKAKYTYGKFNNNQVSITCAKLEDRTFVYTSVAGPDAEIVERLRNEIVQKL
ncbi:hypothetical protein [Colwellia psychrerythraea]|uniref:Uncharacterized protein n=1 Tax=Colwellia psychrerythraea TaxID=28229 RepID=A0A099KLW7_COLPS|nr:hypothetical protein [Colwellia psychrerythraea]KGJ90937.1 hypothetical protein GAB14E_0601 [Colwellia psychrerythraea]